MGDAYQIKNQASAYFLTFQVVGWADVFTRRAYRDIVLESFAYCRQHKGLELFAYVIMTNHVHLIARSSDQQLSNWVRDFKKFTAKQLLTAIFQNSRESRKEWLKMIFEYHAKFNKRSGELQFWTHENHAVELNQQYLIDTRINYIHQNPVRAGWVDKPEDFVCSSARNFAGLDSVIEIDQM